VRRGNVRDAVQGLEWNGQLVIDATNDFDPSDLGGRTSSEVVADLVSPAASSRRRTRSARRCSPPILRRPVAAE
jgi:hypothetical protein